MQVFFFFLFPFLFLPIFFIFFFQSPKSKQNFPFSTEILQLNFVSKCKSATASLFGLRFGSYLDWEEVCKSWTMFLGRWGRISQQKRLWAGLGRRTRWPNCQHTGRHGHPEVNPWWCHQQREWRGLDQVPRPVGPHVWCGRSGCGNHQPGLKLYDQKGKSVPKERSKGGVWVRGVCETEQSARPSRKPWRSQQMPNWFGLEAFSFGSRPRLIETE